MTIPSCYLVVRAGILEARGADNASEKMVVVAGTRWSEYANVKLLYAFICIKERCEEVTTVRDYLAAGWVMQRLCTTQLLETWKYYKAAC